VAGLHSGGTTVSAVPASKRVHGPLTLVHNDREGAGVLTEGSKLAGREAAAPAARSERWSRAALAEESKEGVSRRLSSTAGCGVVLRGWTVGQGGRRWAGGEELRRGQSSPEAVRRGNSGAAQAEVGEERPGEDPGRAAELLRWFAGVGARRCGVARVEQSFCAGGTMGRRWLGLRGAV